MGFQQGMGEYVIMSECSLNQSSDTMNQEDQGHSKIASTGANEVQVAPEQKFNDTLPIRNAPFMVHVPSKLHTSPSTSTSGSLSKFQREVQLILSIAPQLLGSLPKIHCI